jgi:TetR/AcrR family transcriptional regulator, regulator of cefoperazone and chloramphenicol sensitivity
MSISEKNACFTERSTCQERSEHTRQRLIAVAAEVFSELGYGAASTRAIVEEAETNLASIPYYFGSKRGLYNAAAEYIGSNLASRIRPACELAWRELLQEEQNHQETLQKFTDFIVNVTEVVWGLDTPMPWGRFVDREQLDPSEAIDILYAKFMPVVELGSEYVARLTKWPATAAETRIQFLAIMAMVRVICVDRASVLRNTGWGTIGKEEIKIIDEVVRRNMQALFALTPESPQS